MKPTGFSRLSIRRQEEITGYLFIIPFLIGFFLFQGLPFIISFIISFTDLQFVTNIGSLKFIGFKNFITFLHDNTAVESLGRSLLYTVLFVPAIMMSSLILALILNKRIMARNAIRTMIFLPYVSNIVAIAIVWQLLLDPRDGPVNLLLQSMGMIHLPMWLVGGTHIVIPTIVLIACWQGMGFNLVTYLAALQGVPKELYEASEIDGANSLQKFIRVTLPMISPTTFFLTITSLIASTQNYSIVQVLTKGGPGEASRVFPLNIVEEAFTHSRLGYASAQSLVIFTILILATLIQWKMQKRWVNYD
ncbi:MAG TPA: sugar ABC transporter permease [Bacilli bacterium]